jgi:creatinine amidohydrolase
MSGRLLEIAELSSPELDSLDSEKTVFVLVLSPLEVHGPHLPLGTDVQVAEEVRDRTVVKLRERHPELDFVLFPSYFMGSDTIPGSLEVNSKALNYLLKSTASFLADRGFKYLLVVDNHGGPRHQIATAKAVKRLFERRGFYIIAPFLHFYRRMVDNDPELLEHLGAGPGACGDVEDCHGGLNETSLMLCAYPDKVSPEWEGLGRTAINQRRWPNLLLGTVGRALKALGLREMAKDVGYIGVMLCWVTEKDPPNYIGEPRAASPGAGDRMLDAFSGEAARAVEEALDGKAPYYTPIGWSLRFLEPSL